MLPSHAAHQVLSICLSWFCAPPAAVQTLPALQKYKRPQAAIATAWDTLRLSSSLLCTKLTSGCCLVHLNSSKCPFSRSAFILSNSPNRHAGRDMHPAKFIFIWERMKRLRSHCYTTPCHCRENLSNPSGAEMHSGVQHHPWLNSNSLWIWRHVYGAPTSRYTLSSNRSRLKNKFIQARSGKNNAREFSAQRLGRCPVGTHVAQKPSHSSCKGTTGASWFS